MPFHVITRVKLTQIFFTDKIDKRYPFSNNFHFLFFPPSRQLSGVALGGITKVIMVHFRVKSEGGS